MARLELENVVKEFPGANGKLLRAVDQFTLTVGDNELLVLLGPSGCGKTTLLRLIAGLETPSHGSIRLDGQCLDRVEPGARPVAMVFQRDTLYPHLTAAENLALPLRLRKTDKPEIADRVRKTAELLGLNGCFQRKPEHLSGGERQRVALGRAIVRRPSVLLLDEPLSHLDAPLRVQLRTEIARLHAQLQATTIYVTHDQGEAMSLGGRIAVMKDGVLQQVAHPVALHQQPANLFVAQFIGSPPINLFTGTLTRLGKEWLFIERTPGPEMANRINLSIPANPVLDPYAGHPIVLGLRPEAMELGSGDRSTRPILQGQVERLEQLGSENHLHLASAAHQYLVRIPSSQSFAPGERVVVSCDLRQALFFDPATGKRVGGQSG